MPGARYETKKGVKVAKKNIKKKAKKKAASKKKK